VLSGRRIGLVIVAVVVAWYAAVLVGWALPSLVDAVPAGIDHTLDQPRPISVEVTCESLFGDPVVEGTLPALTPQPAQLPALALQREPCAAVHRDARRVVAFDTVVALAGLALGSWLLLRHRRLAGSVGAGADAPPATAAAAAAARPAPRGPAAGPAPR